MSDEVDDIAKLTAAIRAAVKVRGLGPNSLALLEVGDCIALTPSEAEEAARALRPFIAEERRAAAVEALRNHHCRPCGCGWCCSSTPVDRRGELHQRICQPDRADRRAERHV